MARELPVSLPNIPLPRFRRPGRFPRDFFFGVATSDHQCEAYETRWEDVRDRWEAMNGQTPRGRATDFWNRWPEDVALARGLGCSAFRFSVAWARVEPEPGRFDPAVLAHYRGMVDRILAAGMTPVVTLHHFTWPLHVEERGGMTDPEFPEWFAAYAEAVACALGDGVGWWITFNEPTYLPFGYVKPWGQRAYLLPPGLGDASNDEQLRAAAALIRNLFLAHRAARAKIRALHPAAKVGTNPFVLGFPRGLQAWLDQRATAKRDPEAWLRREGRTLAGYPDLVSGVVDVMFGAFARTREREREMLFSEGYAEGRPALLVAAGDPAREVADLAGARVAVVRGSTAGEVMARSAVALEPCWDSSLARAFERLRHGHCRAVLSDDALLERIAAAEPGRWRLVPLGMPAHVYGAAVALNRDSLLREVDAAIREVLEARGEVAPAAGARLVAVAPSRRPAGPAPAGRARRDEAKPDSTMRAIRETWLSGDPLAAVRRRGEIVVGLLRGGSPWAWRGEDGSWQGLEVDIARALARRVFGDERRVRFVAIDPRWRSSLLRSFWVRPLEFIRRATTLFSTVANTDWWYLGMAGRLPAFLCPPECVGQLDFVGFDYYWGIPELRWDRIRGLVDSIRAHYANAPVHPGGLARLLKRYAKTFPGKPIVIIENGCIDRADGVERAEYLRAHLWEVQKARAARIPVAGYVCWSITSNREWGLPFGPDSDFGLYHIDLDRDPALKRVPTPAAEALRQIVADRDAVPSDADALRAWVRKFGLRFRSAGPAAR